MATNTKRKEFSYPTEGSPTYKPKSKGEEAARSRLKADIARARAEGGGKRFVPPRMGGLTSTVSHRRNPVGSSIVRGGPGKAAKRGRKTGGRTVKRAASK